MLAGWPPGKVLQVEKIRDRCALISRFNEGDHTTFLSLSNSEPVILKSLYFRWDKEWKNSEAFGCWRDAHDSSSLNLNVWSASRLSVIKFSHWKRCSTDKDITGTTMRDSTFGFLVREFFLQKNCLSCVTHANECLHLSAYLAYKIF